MPLLLLALLASTPRIDAFVSSCAQVSDGFVAARQGRAVVAPAAGTVVHAGDGGVVLAHCYLDNVELRVMRTEVRGLELVAVEAGARVAQGQVLGAGRDASVRALDADDTPLEAWPRRERLLAPRAEPVLLVVDVEAHRAVRFAFGQPTHEWEVGRGQAEGPKAVRGDLKTPRGLYFVVEKSRGPFTGPVADYYGGVWVKLNYPNPWDAARGLDAGLVAPATAALIEARWEARRLTPQGTRLGGGIGFHGWVAPWDGADGGYGLSWGCLVLQPQEGPAFYELVPLGTPVVLL